MIGPALKEDKLMLTGGQIREARSRLGWSPNELAKRAHVSELTVKRAERTAGEPVITVDHQRKIREAFCGAGIKFDGLTYAR
jgi:ribosome-binding protein aMBF1 (putative translation factor)